ncbi:hypothetical protein CHS0354_005994 [Potamilus streckersoni]|uniref:Uncharacterized protein n=1 Tax=Potamilus streckersoni TaxID=2493646 RepID=A0AAE0RP00_9BIVA|nr:hypothetical protein CHS0354_005994 [Potamilus streckersoni]
MNTVSVSSITTEFLINFPGTVAVYKGLQPQDTGHYEIDTINQEAQRQVTALKGHITKISRAPLDVRTLWYVGHQQPIESLARTAFPSVKWHRMGGDAVKTAISVLPAG